MDDTHHPTSTVTPHGSETPHGAAHHDMHLKLYIGIGLTLIALTGVTVFLSYVNFDKWFGGRGWNMIIGMIVATFKVGLVAAIFMHLLSERWTIYRVLILTVIFVMGLFFLTWLHFYNPITR